MPLSPAEHMLYSATRVITYRKNERLSIGTGFFFTVRLAGGRATTMLITNRHVLAGCDRVDLSLPERGADGLPTRLIVRFQMDLVGEPIGHPDSDVDLVALSVTQLMAMNPRGHLIFPFYVALDRGLFPSEQEWSDFDAIEEVTMVGCPNGLFDEVNNLPIVRRGITATHPNKDYQGRKEFMIDLACFPGSSGSPIFRYNPGVQYDRGSGQYRLGQSRVYLLGVLYAGPTINQRGEIVLGQQPHVMTSTMMHLGMVLKSSQILAFEELARQQIAQ